jgi:hypothetical protein
MRKELRGIPESLRLSGLSWEDSRILLPRISRETVLQACPRWRMAAYGDDERSGHRCRSAKISADLVGAPGRIRTCGTRFRKPLLYPLSYEGLRPFRA